MRGTLDDPLVCEPRTGVDVDTDEVSGIAAATEEAIEPSQWRARPFPFEDGDLLAQREDLDGGIGATAEENAHCS